MGQCHNNVVVFPGVAERILFVMSLEAGAFKFLLEVEPTYQRRCKANSSGKYLVYSSCLFFFSCLI